MNPIHWVLLGLFYFVASAISPEEIKTNYNLFKTAEFAPKYTNVDNTLELKLVVTQRAEYSAALYEKAAALYNEALGLYKEQHMQHAIANFVAAVQVLPYLPDGWNNLSIIAQALGLLEPATKYAALAILYGPTPEKVAAVRSYASCHVNLFIKNGRMRDREIALVYLRKAILLSSQVEKEIFEAHNTILINAGNPKRCIEQLTSMESHFENVAAPMKAMRHSALAICYREAHNGEEAINHFEAAIELNPAESSYHYELGGMFKRTEFPHLMDVSRALTHVQQALELAPTNAVVTYSLAGVYSIANQLEQAIELYERAFRLDPKLEIAFFEAVQLKFTICDWKNRDALLAKIVALVEEQLAKALNNSLLKRDDTATLLTPWHALSLPLPPGLQRRIARRHMRVEAAKAILRPVRAIDALSPDEPLDNDFAAEPRVVDREKALPTGLNVDDDYDDPFDDDADDDSSDAGLANALSSRFRIAPQATWTPVSLDAAIGSTSWRNDYVRIGVVSADISKSNVGQSLIGWLHSPDLNNGQYEIFVYSLAKNDRSGWRQAICGKTDDRCRNIAPMNLDDIEQLIRQDKIDVLINLNGFTKFSRNEIFAKRVAPINVAYKGYPGTMGAYHDYILGDRVLTPLSHHSLYSERIVQLPNSFFLTSYPEGFGHVLDPELKKQYSKETLGLTLDSSEQVFVFCNFNHLYKVTPTMFDSWMRILNQIPDSVLWLLHLPNGADKRLKREAVKRGIKSNRLIFSALFPLSEHLIAKQYCDLFLDTDLFNAHGTATDTLWAGIPLLTLMGETMQSRAASSHLTALNMTELITHSYDEYETLALALARGELAMRSQKATCSNNECAAVQPSSLSLLRRKLEANRLTSHLFCAKRWWIDARLAFTSTQHGTRLVCSHSLALVMLAVNRNKLQKRHLVLPKNLDYSAVPTIDEYRVKTKPVALFDSE